jgi:hypothetical protein
MLKNLKKLYWIGFGTALSLVLSGLLLVANPERVKVWAATPAENILSHQSLSSLGKFKKGGNFTIPDQFANIFGTNTIKWGAGQRPMDVIPTGVWNSAFKVGQLSIAQINPTLDMAAASLSNYKFLADMPLTNLTAGLPSLAQLNIADIGPVAELVATNIASGLLNPPAIDIGESTIAATTIGDLVSIPGWQDLALPKDLTSYAASALPGLANTPIGNFPNVLANPASAFPGLANMPIVNMPGINVPAGYQIGYFDTIRTNEPAIRKVISGSRETPNAKCTDKKCGHIEVQALIGGVLSGAQIVDGDTQRVNGGYGFLKALASTEPAGMQPYGEPIQEVYSGLDAQSGDIERSWYFNVCNHGWPVDWGCSAHFIGPIPIGSLHEGDKIPLLLGNISIPVQVPGVNPAKLTSAVKSAVKSAVTGVASPASNTTASAPQVAPTTTVQPLNLTAATSQIAALLPQANPTEIAKILQEQAAKIDPATNQPYPKATILKQAVQQLVGGSNSPNSGNTTSLGLGQSVDSIIFKLD